MKMIVPELGVGNNPQAIYMPRVMGSDKNASPIQIFDNLLNDRCHSTRIIQGKFAHHFMIDYDQPLANFVNLLEKTNTLFFWAKHNKALLEKELGFTIPQRVFEEYKSPIVLHHEEVQKGYEVLHMMYVGDERGPIDLFKWFSIQDIYFIDATP